MTHAFGDAPQYEDSFGRRSLGLISRSAVQRAVLVLKSLVVANVDARMPAAASESWFAGGRTVASAAWHSHRGRIIWRALDEATATGLDARASEELHGTGTGSLVRYVASGSRPAPRKVYPTRCVYVIVGRNDFVKQL